jgi:hypothetical protein
MIMKYEITYEGTSWIYSETDLKKTYPMIYEEIALKAQQHEIFTVGHGIQILVVVLPTSTH